MATWLTLAEVKAHLNIPDVDTGSDAELVGAMDAAVEWLEARVGPVDQRTVTEVVPAGAALLLSYTPVLSLTSVAGAYGNGQSIDVATLYLDGAAGVVKGASGTRRFAYPVTVTYVAGLSNPSTCPASYRQATLEIIRAIWGAQRAGASAASAADFLQGRASDMTPDQVGSLGLAQYRAQAIIQQYRRAVTFA